jgi:hypothetical protein
MMHSSSLFRPRWAGGIVLCLIALGLANGAVAQQHFATPQAAVDSLVSAAKQHEPGSLTRIFGEGAREILLSGDDEEDRRRAEKFIAAADDATELQAPNDTTRILLLGNGRWPFPVPIVKQGDQWLFDLAAGKTEIQDRRIGENELSAIEACRTFVEAQREYYRDIRDGDEVQQYAQRFLSTPGKHDGLYWPAEKLSDMSPLGTRLVDAGLDKRAAGDHSPYKGYRFRILTRQGPAAPGGAFDYMINGRLLVGVGLIAYPAEWGVSGVMSFICNQQGRIYQKNLGPATEKLVAEILRYNPDKTWTLVDE